MSQIVEFKIKERLKTGYITIPREIIENNLMGKLRVSVFSMLAIKRGIDNEILAPTKNIVAWLNKKEDRHKDGVNSNVEKTIQDLIDLGFITESDDDYGLKMKTYLYNNTKVYESCKLGYAVIYCDEIKKILKYEGGLITKGRYNHDVILLVFAYLRMSIPRRKNEVYLEEKDLEYRKITYPEAYCAYFNNIAAEIGLTCEVVSTAIDVLVELGLIVCKELKRVKDDDHFYSRFKIFANTYKRENEYLLASGKSYYETEIKNIGNKYGIIQ